MVRTDYADLLFTGGPVYFGRGRVAEVPVVVRDGRLRVGAAEPAHEVIDLDGRLLLPGFQDAQVHTAFGGLALEHYDTALPAREPTRDELVAGLLRAQRTLFAYGVTAWQDTVHGPASAFGDTEDAYRVATEAGLLTAGVNGVLTWHPARGIEQIAELCVRRERLRHCLRRAATVWLRVDGALEEGDAALLEPYHRSLSRGHATIAAHELRQIVTLLDGQGFQVHFQTVGDRAVRDALDAVESARRANGARGNRHHLAQIRLVHPQDIDRFAALGVTASIRPMSSDERMARDVSAYALLGPDRAGRQYPFPALHAGGAMLAAGSDWPFGDPEPWQGIHATLGHPLLDHADPAEREQPALGFAAMVDAYTTGSAYVRHAADSGRIATGRRADLVVLDRNPFDDRSTEIGPPAVELTFVGGQVVHRGGAPMTEWSRSGGPHHRLRGDLADPTAR
ncbi:amidohydrolase [Nocardia brasiliensis]